MSRATVFDLIRHGETAWVAQAASARVKRFGGRMNNVPLSDTGRQQGFNLGTQARQQGVIPQQALCSPAARTLDTHDQSRQGLKRPVSCIIDPRLQELHWGDWTDQPRSILEHDATLRDIELRGYDFQPPQGESPRMVRERVLTTLVEYAARSITDYWWVHTHRNAIKSTVGPWLGWSTRQIFDESVALVSLTRIIICDGTPKLVFFNRPVTQVLAP